jgi:hypothetical protein
VSDAHVPFRSRADLATAEAAIFERRLTHPSAKAEARDISANIDAITSALLSPLSHLPLTERAHQHASLTAHNLLEAEFVRLEQLIQAVTHEGWDFECRRRPVMSSGIT